FPVVCRGFGEFRPLVIRLLPHQIGVFLPACPVHPVFYRVFLHDPISAALCLWTLFVGQLHPFALIRRLLLLFLWLHLPVWPPLFWPWQALSLLPPLRIQAFSLS